MNLINKSTFDKIALRPPEVLTTSNFITPSSDEIKNKKKTTESITFYALNAAHPPKCKRL